MSRLWLLLAIGCLTSCTESRMVRYNRLLDPAIGTGKKDDINRKLGRPVACRPQKSGYELCEYRTASQRNEPIPQVYQQRKGFGPDLSPYDYFDVLELTYDGFGVLQNWKTLHLSK